MADPFSFGMKKEHSTERLWCACVKVKRDVRRNKTCKERPKCEQNLQLAAKLAHSSVDHRRPSIQGSKQVEVKNNKAHLPQDVFQGSEGP